ncbi:MAG: prohibitin family protein [Pseudomonadota bacterium]
MRFFSIGLAALVGLLALRTIGGSFYTVGERERGVLLRNGAVIGTAEPGLGFKLPWIDSVVDVSVETNTFKLDKLAAYSRDQQDAELRISVTYHVPPGEVREVYSRFGSVDGLVSRVVAPKVYEQTKNIFGQFNAVTAVQDRTRLNAEIASAIHAAVKSLDAPIVLEAVQIENIDFSDTYEKSIEQRMLAEVEVQKVRQNADREKVQAEIAVTQARARADAVRASAQAEAEAITLKGNAEASAIKARGDALKENPNLVGLIQAERWDGKLPTTMVPGSAVPFVSVK